MEKPNTDKKNTVVIWAGAICYLDMLGKLQEWFYRYYIYDHLNRLNCFFSLIIVGGTICYSSRLHDFSVIIPRCYKDANVNSLFPGTTILDFFDYRMLSFVL